MYPSQHPRMGAKLHNRLQIRTTPNRLLAIKHILRFDLRLILSAGLTASQKEHTHRAMSALHAPCHHTELSFMSTPFACLPCSTLVGQWDISRKAASGRHHTTKHLPLLIWQDIHCHMPITKWQNSAYYNPNGSAARTFTWFTPGSQCIMLQAHEPWTCTTKTTYNFWDTPDSAT